MKIHKLKKINHGSVAVINQENLVPKALNLVQKIFMRRLRNLKFKKLLKIYSKLKIFNLLFKRIKIKSLISKMNKPFRKEMSYQYRLINNFMKLLIQHFEWQ